MNVDLTTINLEFTFITDITNIIDIVNIVRFSSSSGRGHGLTTVESVLVEITKD